LHRWPSGLAVEVETGEFELKPVTGLTSPASNFGFLSGKSVVL
jgi:hypothetical protein